ncbi:MAG: TaqI-like C-terminal specificity domain-containing protein [Kofleriaceae bacterium]
MDPALARGGVAVRQAEEMTLGVVYTPRDVTAPMIEHALGPLVAGKSPRQIEELRICDFSIGEGAFLDEAIRFLVAHGADRDRVVVDCLYGADIDPDVVGRVRARLQIEHLHIGDALAIEWPMFDAVIGNPPYIRQEKLSAETKQRLRGFASYDGVADLYIYFIELAARITKPGGRYCIVVPSKLRTVSYARALRKHLADRMPEIIDLPSDAFPDHDAFPCILVGPTERKGPANGDPWTDRPPSTTTLGDLVTPPMRGIVTGCNRAFVIDGVTRDRLHDRGVEPHWIRPFVKGRDIRPYRIELADRYVLMLGRGCDPPSAIIDHLTPMRAELEPGTGRKPGSYKWYELQDPIGELAASTRPRLFYQDIQTAPACALDTTGLVPDTTVWMLATDDERILRLLNSSWYRDYAKQHFPPALNGAVRPKREYMLQLPIPDSF